MEVGSHDDMFDLGFNWMQKEVHELAKAKGWWDNERNPLELLALIISEIGEAIEAVRKPGPSPKISAFTALEEELADTIIRIMDMAGHMGMDLGEAILSKHEYNKARSHRHGGKLY